MRILFDATAYTNNGKGVARYISNLLAHLVRVDDGNEYTITVRDGVVDQFREAEWSTRVRVIGVRFPGLLRWKLFGLKRIDARLKCDVVHSADELAPVSVTGSLVVTVHELHRIRRRLSPMLVRVASVRGAALGIYSILFWRTVRLARRFIAVSKATESDLIREYGLDETRITVIHEGADHVAESVLRGGDGGRPYVFAFATGDSRERPATLLEALVGLKRGGRAWPKVLFVGADVGLRDQLVAEARRRRLERDVEVRGFVADAELWRLMRGATAFIDLTRYEGFGLQVVEAMACGVPVVASDCPAVREVARDCAVFVNPERPADLVRALTYVMSSDQVRCELSRRALERSREFSWAEAARRTRELYTENVRGSR